MAEKKKEEVVYEGEFSGRVNRTEDTTENILRNTKSAETFVVYSGRTSKFTSDKRYRVTITEIAEESEAEVDKSAADKKPTP